MQNQQQALRRSSVQAFTLIELMIVVAIIGILAAISVPAYNDYTARAKVSEIVNLAGAGKVTLFDSYASNGFMPSDQPPPTTTVGGWLKAFQNSRAVTNLPVYTGGGNQAKITVTLNDSVGIDSGGLDIQFIYTVDAGSMVMECSAQATHNKVSSIGAATTLEERYLPGICR